MPKMAELTAYPQASVCLLFCVCFVAVSSACLLVFNRHVEIHVQHVGTIIMHTFDMKLWKLVVSQWVLNTQTSLIAAEVSE